MKLFRQQSVSVNASDATRAAFTMIEIALCLGVIAFALLAIMGSLPRGMTVQRDNREETIINQDAAYLMDAIRSGSRGMNDLTNYLLAISIKSGANPAVHKNPYFPPPSTFLLPGKSVSDLFNGEIIIGLLSTPQYYQGRTNTVTAYMRAISGNASEKPPQADGSIQSLAFAYRLTSELTPYISPNTQYLPDPNIQTRNLQTNLFELRLTFRWPLLPNGSVGQGKLTFRTLASGSLCVTNFGGGMPDCYFIQPSTFVAAP